MILTPNHIFVPAAYLGITGSRRVFSAGNPIYTISGRQKNGSDDTDANKEPKNLPIN